MGGWMGGWMEGKAGLRIAYSNQKSSHTNVWCQNFITWSRTLTPIISGLAEQNGLGRAPEQNVFFFIKGAHVEIKF
jgi:hypothetical protein